MVISPKSHLEILKASYSHLEPAQSTIKGVDTLIFEAYFKAFYLYRPEELKVVVIDNAGFHSTKNIKIPHNIRLIRIPPYTPELNPCEKVWQYLKERFKNRTFENIKELKLWLKSNCKNRN